MKEPKQPSMPKAPLGRRMWLKVRSLLIGLLLICVAVVSGCKSSSTIPSCPASQVTVDQSLMVEPNYLKTLLDSLSSKPSEPTPK